MRKLGYAYTQYALEVRVAFLAFPCLILEGNNNAALVLSLAKCTSLTPRCDSSVSLTRLCVAALQVGEDGKG
jgi:hypothetical protein